MSQNMGEQIFRGANVRNRGVEMSQNRGVELSQNRGVQMSGGQVLHNPIFDFVFVSVFVSEQVREKRSTTTERSCSMVTKL